MVKPIIPNIEQNAASFAHRALGSTGPDVMRIAPQAVIADMAVSIARLARAIRDQYSIEDYPKMRQALEAHLVDRVKMNSAVGDEVIAQAIVDAILDNV